MRLGAYLKEQLDDIEVVPDKRFVEPCGLNMISNIKVLIKSEAGRARGQAQSRLANIEPELQGRLFRRITAASKGVVIVDRGGEIAKPEWTT